MLANLIIYLHFYNVFLVLASGLITGIWGLVIYFRKGTMNKPWRTALIVTTALGVLQGLLGVLLLLFGLLPGGGPAHDNLYYLHYVYGGIAALAIPVGITYATAGKNPRRDILIFSIAALIVFAAGFRGWMTGPVHWPAFHP